MICYRHGGAVMELCSKAYLWYASLQLKYVRYSQDYQDDELSD